MARPDVIACSISARFLRALIERFHLFTRLIYVWHRRMADSTCCKERPERYLQLSFEDKKSYIANLSLMGEIDP